MVQRKTIYWRYAKYGLYCCDHIWATPSCEFRRGSGRDGVTRCCYGCCQTKNLGCQESAAAEKRAVEKTSFGKIKNSSQPPGVSTAVSVSRQSPAIRNARPAGAIPLR